MLKPKGGLEPGTSREQNWCQGGGRSLVVFEGSEGLILWEVSQKPDPSKGWKSRTPEKPKPVTRRWRVAAELSDREIPSPWNKRKGWAPAELLFSRKIANTS